MGERGRCPLSPRKRRLDPALQQVGRTLTDIREVWAPTAANFFGRVGRNYLEELWRELLDLSQDHPKATSFAKLKKAEKAERLEKLFSDEATREAHGVTETQTKRIAKWLPEPLA